MRRISVQKEGLTEEREEPMTDKEHERSEEYPYHSTVTDAFHHPAASDPERNVRSA
jgi:hypothetical protein